MEIAFNSRCLKENSEILEKLVTLREEHAKVLGYPTHAAFMQEILMAKNPTTVENFLKNLVEKVTPRWVQEKEEMLQLKKKEVNSFIMFFLLHFHFPNSISFHFASCSMILFPV